MSSRLPPPNSQAGPAAALVHELQVHQVELEMQNEELRSAEAALAESRNLYLDLFDFAPVGYMTLTDQGLITAINLTCAELLKTERAKLINRRFEELVADEDRDRWHRLFTQELQGDESVACDLTLQCRNGSRVSARLNLRRSAAANATSATRVAVTDITPIKEACAALAASELRFRTLFDQIGDAVGLYDVVKRRIVAANRSAGEMLGCPPDEILELGVAQISDDVPPYAEVDALARMEAAFTAGTPDLVEWRVRDRKGRRLWVEVSLRRIAIGGEDLLLIVARDMTERNAALAAVRDREERLHLFFSHAPIGMMTVTTDLRLTDVNEVLCRLLGYTAEELKSKRVEEITYPDDRAADREVIGEMRAGRILHFTVEKRYLHKDGHPVWVRVTRAVIRDDAGTVRYGIGLVEDIRERREAERLRAERLERQRDVLVREVHHRIKNNLQGVISLIEQLQRKRPEAAEALEEAAGQISAIAVVHGLHSTTLSAELRPRPLVLAIVDAIAHLSGAAIACHESDDVADWDWQLEARDTVAVALIINELLYNAVKHNASTGSVEVALGCRAAAFKVSVRNRPARLPPGFDFPAGSGLGTGLTLIASLLPRQGARLSIRQHEDGVEAELELTHPCVSAVPANNQETKP